MVNFQYLSTELLVLLKDWKADSSKYLLQYNMLFQSSIIHTRTQLSYH